MSEMVRTDKIFQSCLKDYHYRIPQSSSQTIRQAGAIIASATHPVLLHREHTAPSEFPMLHIPIDNQGFPHAEISHFLMAKGLRKAQKRCIHV